MEAGKPEKKPPKQVETASGIASAIANDNRPSDSEGIGNIESGLKHAMDEAKRLGLEIKDETPGALDLAKGDFLHIDLASYPELMEKIKKLAHDELRTHEMQALYIIREKLMD